MLRTMRLTLIPLALVGMLVLAACGRSASDDESFAMLESAGAAPAGAAAAPVATSAPAAAPFAAAALPAPAVAPAPRALVAESKGAPAELTEEDVALVSQQRIIVRTVDMALEVAKVSTTLDSVAGLAREFGGWVVSSDRSRKHHAFVSVRVPADKLDEAVLRLRGMAVEVES